MLSKAGSRGLGGSCEVAAPSVHFFNDRNRRAGSTGLVRKSSMPAARQRSRSPSSAEAVIAMIGTRSSVGLAGADRAGGVEAVEPGHPAVHQHGGVPVPSGQPLHGLDAVVDHVDGAAEVLEQPGRDHLVDGVVLDDEDPHARRGRARPPRAGRACGDLAGEGVDERVEQLDWRTGLVRHSRDAGRAGGIAGRGGWLDDSSSRCRLPSAEPARIARASSRPSTSGSSRSRTATSNGLSSAAADAERGQRLVGGGDGRPAACPRRRAVRRGSAGSSRCRRRPAPGARGAGRGRPRGRSAARTRRGGTRR